MLLLQVGTERLAIHLEYIERIVETSRVYFVPSAIPPVKGVITAGHDTIMVVDLSRIFSLPPYYEDSGRVIVVSENGKRRIGLHAGNQRFFFAWQEDLEEAQFITQRTSNYVSGAVKIGEGTLKIIDWRYIFDDVSTRLAERRSA
ncbi:MAG: chemotaxis protein CheW [Deltaproteobacteria bacterium]|nr:chemotaxis protein CheW [Deltaproteobacteria bacterium]